MQPNSSINDTLYDDILGEMEEFELLLFEVDGIKMGRSLTQIGSNDDGQALPGIYCLFGIEICLAAAGQPSKDKSCSMLRSWGQENTFPLEPESIDFFKARILEIAQLRIDDDCDPEKINAATEAMIKRIDHAAQNPPLLHPTEETITEPQSNSQSLEEAPEKILTGDSQLAPAGLLPRKGEPDGELFSKSFCSEIDGWDKKRRIQDTLSRWSGIYEDRGIQNPKPVPEHQAAKLWEEIKDLRLIEGIGRHFDIDNYKIIQVIHAWCAWCAGAWDEETKADLFPMSVAGEASSRRLKDSKYYYADQKFKEFVFDYNEYITDLFVRLTEKGSIETIKNDFCYYKGKLTLTTVLNIIENCDHQIDFYTIWEPLEVNILPEGKQLEIELQRIRAIDQKILRKVAPYTGIALPYILDAIDDSQYVSLLKSVAGAFAERLVEKIDGLSFWRVLQAEQYYPGRKKCGVTNLDPLYNELANSSKALIEEVIKNVGNSRLVAFCSTKLELMAGKAPEDLDGDIGSVLADHRFIRMTHRIPNDTSKWKTEKQERLYGLADFFMPGNAPNREQVNSSDIENFKDAACLHAEAINMDTWQEAAYDIASALKQNQPFEIENYSISQLPLEPGGSAVFKGKRRLRKLPSSHTTLAAVTFLKNANLVNLIHLALRRDAIERYIDSGSYPEEPNAKQHEVTFGLNLATWLEKRQDITHSKSFELQIREKLDFEVERESLSDDSAQCEAGRESPELISPPIDLNELQEQGWTTSYWGKARRYESTRKIPGYLTFEATPTSDPKGKANGLPSEAVNLHIYEVRIRGEITQFTDDRIERICRYIAQEFAIAAK